MSKFISTSNGIEPALTVDLYCEGFRCVLGASENTHVGPAVIKSAPNMAKRYDTNNGMLVIYDETGAPWVAAVEEVSRSTLDRLIEAHSLRLGAYVPCSNDNGAFLSGLLCGDVGVSA